MEKRKVALQLVALAAVAAVIIWWAVARRGSREGTRPAAPDQRPAAVTRTPTPEPDVTSPPATDAEKAAEEELDKVVEDAGRAATMRVEGNRQMTRRRRVFLEEDKVFLASPTYDERREEMLAEARSVLEGIDSSDAKAVVEAAQAELDEFWKRGGLSAADGYEHGYLAQAILESSLAKDPENFGLLDLYKEAVSTTTPNHIYDEEGKKDPDVIDRLARHKSKLSDIADRQKALVISGKAPPSPEAMLAMYDWMYLAYVRKDYKAGFETLKWLAANADAFGAGRMKEQFESQIEMADPRGAVPLGNIYIWNSRDVRTEAINARRIPSFKGSPDRRAQMVWLWNYEGKISTSVTR